MEKYKKSCKAFLISEILCFFLSSFAIGIIPVINNFSKPTQAVLSYISGAVFWAGIVIGIVVSVILKRNLKKLKLTLWENYMLKKRHNIVGALSFSGSPINLAIYIILGCGFMIIITDIVAHIIPTDYMFLVISVTLFAFELHSVIDGESYIIYKTIKEGTSDEI